ncbi:MAG: hypothetical protein ACYC3P_08530 [Bellilinea sp.]
MIEIGQKTFRFFYNKLGVFVTFLALILIFLGFVKEWGNFLKFSWSFHPEFILISFVAYACQLLLMFFIWHLIVSALTGNNNIKLNSNAYFLSAIAKRIPTPLPFLGIRYSIYRKSSQNEPSIVLIGSVLELLVLIIAGSIFIPITGKMLTPNNPIIEWTWTISLAVSIFLFIPSGILSLINKIIAKFGKGIILPTITIKILLFWVGLSILAYAFNTITVHYLIIGISDSHVSIQDTILAASLYYLLTYITMFLAGGLGIKEFVFGYTMRQYMAFPSGVIVSLVIRLLMISVELAATIVVKIILQSSESSVEADPNKEHFN